jgi:hypothetical protein
MRYGRRPMKRSHRLLAGIVVVVSVSGAEARRLSFEDRVKSQEAIERVYYSHQIGATKPFEEAIPGARLEEKVVKYLRQSAALEKFWGWSITADALEREVDRIEVGSQMAGRLREMNDALGNGPFLIAECLARPILADRMARRFYAWDKTLHRAAREEAQELREGLADRGVDASAGNPRKIEMWVVRAEPEDETPETGTTATMRLPAEDFVRWCSSMPALVRAVGPVREERDAFVLEVVLEETSDGVHTASYVVKKRTWDDWWSEASKEVFRSSVETVSAATG